MYIKDKLLLLLTSASAVPNNLAVNLSRKGNTSESIAVIHQGYINIVPVNDYELKSKYIPNTDAPLRNKVVVTQVMWCNLGYDHVLVITSSLGLQIFDCEGLECKFSHPCYDGPENKEAFARGLATSGDFICIGNSIGCVRVFAVMEEGEIGFVDRKLQHREAITDIAACGDLVVSADEGGCILLWTLSREELINWAELPSYECLSSRGSLSAEVNIIIGEDDELNSLKFRTSTRYSCTNVKIWQDLIAAAYGSGHIRLFSAEKRTGSAALLVEVGAHARWITGMDLAPEKGLLLSVSEDSLVKVWQIKKGEQTVITHNYSTQIKDSMLIGGKFLNTAGTAFCVSSYDSTLIHCFAMMV